MKTDIIEVRNLKWERAEGEKQLKFHPSSNQPVSNVETILSSQSSFLFEQQDEVKYCGHNKVWLDLRGRINSNLGTHTFLLRRTDRLHYLIGPQSTSQPQTILAVAVSNKAHPIANHPLVLTTSTLPSFQKTEPPHFDHHVRLRRDKGPPR